MELLTCTIVGATPIQESGQWWLINECIYHILLPFCYFKGSHWVAMDADMEERHCIVFDSLRNYSNGNMKQKIALVLDALGELEVKGSGWTFQYPNCAQQMDGHSCNIAMVDSKEAWFDENIIRQLHGFWKPVWVLLKKSIPQVIDIMQPNIFAKMAKQVTKLTDKAKAALKEKLDGPSTKKQKNDMNAENAAPSQSKKAKSILNHGHTKDDMEDNITATPSPTATPVQGHQAVVHTKEEEADPHNDVIMVDNDESNDDANETCNPSPDIETAEDELSTQYDLQLTQFVNKMIA
ncbi:hypothetical protein BDR06DRAFT_966605 [Suillus hirtellus]|nr:hypothetical protein BDR06DRAFT_966605 [Suillus hirtellus]